MGTAKPQVVIIGAGFGGLAAAKALADAPVDVTVVDQRNHHTFQPLLYQVATAGLGVDDICYATRGIFQRQANARALLARVTSIDLDQQRVMLANGPPLPYDQLVLALGAVTADYGVPGVTTHAFGLKSADEAISIRNHILRQFEAAEQSSDAGFRAAATTVVIAGGGPTGVEMAGGFAELFDRVLAKDFTELDVSASRVILVEGQDRLLGTFTPELGAHARTRLEQMGVEVMLGNNVASVEADHIRLTNDTVIATNTLVWAAGVSAHPMAEQLGETTRGGRLVVNASLQLPDHPNVFVIGDMAAAVSPAGELVPQVAPAAIQAGDYVAEVVAARLADDPTPPPFEYHDKGSMATIGRNAAVVELPNGAKITGFAGWVAWLALHLVMLIGFRNRANVLVNWAWNYLTYDRGSRLILEPDVVDDQ